MLTDDGEHRATNYMVQANAAVKFNIDLSGMKGAALAAMYGGRIDAESGLITFRPPQVGDQFDFRISPTGRITSHNPPYNMHAERRAMETMEGHRKMNSRRELELAREAMLRQMAETEQALKKYEKYPAEEEFPNLVRFQMKKKHVVRRPVQLGAIVSSHHYTIGEVYKGLRADYPANAYHSSVPYETVAEEITLTYVAARIEDNWYLTGNTSPQKLTHDEFIEFLVDGEVDRLEFFADPSDVRTIDG